MEEFGSVSHMFSEDNSFENGTSIVRRTLSLAERMTVLRKYAEKPNVRDIAREYDCCRSQIRNIIRHGKQYQALWSKCKDKNPARVRRPQDQFLLAVGLILSEWVDRARYYQINITDDMLRSVGQEIADHMKYKEFKSNNRWLGRFKQKFRLHDLELVNTVPADAGQEEPKRLDIADIIDEIRREHGDSKIPEFEHEDNSILVENFGNSEWDNAFGTESSSSVPDVMQFTELQSDDEFSSEDAAPDATMDDAAKEIESYREALNLLGPLEQFVLLKENIRAVGLINQLENLFRDEIAKTNESVSSN